MTVVALQLVNEGVDVLIVLLFFDLLLRDGSGRRGVLLLLVEPSAFYVGRQRRGAGGRVFRHCCGGLQMSSARAGDPNGNQRRLSGHTTDERVLTLATNLDLAFVCRESESGRGKIGLGERAGEVFEGFPAWGPGLRCTWSATFPAPVTDGPVATHRKSDFTDRSGSRGPCTLT